MAEGGLLRWKVQKVKMRGPVADYSSLRDPLPPPPLGMVWRKNEETREWKLVKEEVENNHHHEEDEEKQESNEDEANENDNSTIGEIISTTIDELASEVGSLNCGKSESGGGLGGGGTEHEWELLSDKSPSITSIGVVVSRNGSIRSINSNTVGTGSTNHLSQTFRFQRSTSSSTLDSNDGIYSGPSSITSMGIPGVDYVEHVVLPTDTLQGLCLAYKISATRLRQANQFSGSTLSLAPKKLIIPLSYKALKSGKIRMQDRESKEFKIQAFLAENTDMRASEARAYLDLSNWDLEEALHSAREDKEWEKGEVKKEVEDDTEAVSKLGDKSKKGFTMKVGPHESVPLLGRALQAARGVKPSSTSVKSHISDDRSVSSDHTLISGASGGLDTALPVYTGVPAVVKNSITAQDVYKGPVHDGDGVEMQDLMPSTQRSSTNVSSFPRLV